MITYINSANANRYSRLFSEAEDALIRAAMAKDGKDYATASAMFGQKITDAETKVSYFENGINSLNTYFSWIKDLLEIERATVIDEDGNPVLNDNNQPLVEDLDGLKFAMLPIDEEVFKIDANARTISVPADFQKNGLGVQGDEIAEIVYFTIDRFYDHTDLFNQNVMIEWVAPEYLDDEGKKVSPKGYSIPTVKVLDDSAEKVVFGWALASAITNHPGTVTFAVRFFKVSDDGDIQYSLSTLTASAKIQAGIGLDIPKLLKNEGGLEGYTVLDNKIKLLIKERAENSSFGAGDVAHDPKVYELVVDPTNKKAPYVIVLKNVDDEWIATVSGCGYSDDAGDISYFWKKFNYYDGERISTSNDSAFDYEPKYTQLTIAQAQELNAKNLGIKFYTKKAGTVTDTYELCDLATVIADGGTVVYRNDSECTIDGVGVYRMVVKNRKGNHSSTTDSEPMVVFPPAVPQDLTISADALLEGDDDTATLEVGYTIPDEPDTAPRMKGYYLDDDEEEINPKYAFDPANEEAHFEWFFKALGATAASALTAADDDTLVVTAEGDYFCRVSGSLNGETSATADTAVCRVTYPPVAPIVTIAGIDPMAGNGEKALASDPTYVIPTVIPENMNIADIIISVGGTSPLTASISGLNGKANHPLSDEIYYQWFEYTLKEKQHTVPYDDDVFEAYKGVYTPAQKNNQKWNADVAVTEKKKVTDVSNANEIKYTPAKDGWYFCQITNVYNGREEVVSSPLAKYDSSLDN